MRRIRYSVQLDDAEAARLVSLGGVAATLEQARTWRAREDEADFQSCPDEVVLALLEGLILDRRGPKPASSPAPGSNDGFGGLTNNKVLKQLRIALELQASDVLALVDAGGGRVGKGELGALFRKPGTRNYRACGDQVLRQFLTGLATRRDV